MDEDQAPATQQWVLVPIIFSLVSNMRLFDKGSAGSIVSSYDY